MIIRFRCELVGKVGHPLAVHQEHELNPRAAPRFATVPSPMLSLLSNKSCPVPRRVVT